MLLIKITASLDENMKETYRVNVLEALYFVRKYLDQGYKNASENWFQKARFTGTQVKNMKIIAPSQYVALEINFNDYVTCDDELFICAIQTNEIVDLSKSSKAQFRCRNRQ